MYSNFIQFTIPKIGQALVAAVLYLNFMQLPFVQIFAGKTPFLYLGIPILLVGLVSYVSRDPLGTGMVWAGVLTGVYVFCDLVSLVFWFIGGLPRQIWQAVYGGGLLAWAVTALWLFYGWRRAQKLCTTTYRLTTQKPLPGGQAAHCADQRPARRVHHAGRPGRGTGTAGGGTFPRPAGADGGHLR